MEPDDELSVMLGAFDDEFQFLFGKGEVIATPTQAVQLDMIARRFYVRSVFALAEAIAYRLKQEALEEGRRRLSVGERALCSEESYELSQKGDVEIRPTRLRFLSNIRFAFRVAAKANGLSWQLDVAGAGWQALLKATKVRDRLMHPKTAQDLRVGDDEVTIAAGAQAWLHEQMAGYLDAYVAHLKDQVAKTTREIEKYEPS